jgi:hypothetical protein
MKSLWVAAAVAVAGTALGIAPAQACRSAQFVSGIVHSALPPSLPEGLVVAEAEFPTDLSEGEFRRSGGEARILRVIRGNLPGAIIRVSSDGGQTSCDYAFANGRSGLLVGRLRVDKGETVLEPVWVVRRSGFQMR